MAVGNHDFVYTYGPKGGILKATCRVCKLSWVNLNAKAIKHPCAGVPVYEAWAKVPEHLKTKTQLKKDKLKPGGEPDAMITLKNRTRWFDLYDVAKAVAIKKEMK